MDCAYFNIRYSLIDADASLRDIHYSIVFLPKQKLVPVLFALFLSLLFFCL